MFDFKTPSFEMPKFTMPKFDQPNFAMPKFTMPDMKGLTGMFAGFGDMFKGLPNVLGAGGLGGMLGGGLFKSSKFWILVALAIGVTLLLAYGAVKIAKSKQVHKTIRHAGGSITGMAK